MVVLVCCCMGYNIQNLHAHPDAQYLSEAVVTTWYAPPEVLEPKVRPGTALMMRNIIYTEAVDVWSLGALTLEMVATSRPFVCSSRSRFMDAVVRPLFNPKGIRDAVHASVSNELVDLITRMLEHDPVRRPTMQQLMADPVMVECLCVQPVEVPKKRVPALVVPPSTVQVLTPSTILVCDVEHVHDEAWVVHPGFGFPAWVTGDLVDIMRTVMLVGSGNTSIEVYRAWFQAWVVANTFEPPKDWCLCNAAALLTATYDLMEMTSLVRIDDRRPNPFAGLCGMKTHAQMRLGYQVALLGAVNGIMPPEDPRIEYLASSSGSLAALSVALKCVLAGEELHLDVCLRGYAGGAGGAGGGGVGSASGPNTKPVTKRVRVA